MSEDAEAVALVLVFVADVVAAIAFALPALTVVDALRKAVPRNICITEAISLSI